MVTGNPLDFRNDSGSDSPSRSGRDHIARPQFRGGHDDGANAHGLTIDFSHQSYLTVTIGEESIDYLVRDWPRPCFHDASRIVLGCDTSNGSVMDFQKAACLLRSHLPNSDGHDAIVLRG